MKRKPFTLRKAIEDSIDMWTWLAETGKEKTEYFISKGIDIFTLPYACPLCKYYSNHFKYSKCENCFLQHPSLLGLCTPHYYSWAGIYNPIEKKKYANTILKLLKQEHAKRYKNSKYK